MSQRLHTGTHRASRALTLTDLLAPPTARSYGVELLHVVGFIYLSKSKHYLASSHGPLWGIGGMFHSITSSAHIVSSTVSTVRAALELKKVFEELQKAEESGITEERKKELEERAATKG